MPNLRRLERANRDIAAAKARGGLGGWLGKLSGSARAGLAFVSLYTIPSIRHDAPESPRMEPAY